jgi:hypothetical protein
MGGKVVSCLLTPTNVRNLLSFVNKIAASRSWHGVFQDLVGLRLLDGKAGAIGRECLPERLRFAFGVEQFLEEEYAVAGAATLFGISLAEPGAGHAGAVTVPALGAGMDAADA